MGTIDIHNSAGQFVRELFGGDEDEAGSEPISRAQFKKLVMKYEGSFMDRFGNPETRNTGPQKNPSDPTNRLAASPGPNRMNPYSNPSANGPYPGSKGGSYHGVPQVAIGPMNAFPSDPFNSGPLIPDHQHHLAPTGNSKFYFPDDQDFSNEDRLPKKVDRALNPNVYGGPSTVAGGPAHFRHPNPHLGSNGGMPAQPGTPWKQNGSFGGGFNPMGNQQGAGGPQRRSGSIPQVQITQQTFPFSNTNQVPSPAGGYQANGGGLPSFFGDRAGMNAMNNSPYNEGGLLGAINPSSLPYADTRVLQNVELLGGIEPTMQCNSFILSTNHSSMWLGSIIIKKKQSWSNLFRKMN